MLCALTAIIYSNKASASLSGTYTIDPGGTASATVYLSLTSAISDLVSGTRGDGGPANGSGVSGPVILELASGYTVSGETFPLTLNSVTGASGTNTITIRPASGVSSALSITSANGTATLNIDGGNYFIIDGRPGGTGSNKYITLDNTNTAAPAVQYINDASNNTIKYCTISGVNTTTTTGAVVLFSTTTGSTGNDNNTIDYCDIRDGSTKPLNAIYSAGTASMENSGNTISNCNIYNFFNAGAASNGIYLATNSDSWTITGNSFYQTGSLTATAGSIHRVLYIQAGSGHTVTNNYIGGSTAQCGGSAWTISGSFASRMICIDLGVGTTSTTSVQGNTIAKFNWSTSANTSSTTGIFCGINVSTGNVNIGTTTGNTIGNGTSTSSITTTTSGTGGLTVGITSSTSGTVSISNNTIGSITAYGSSTGVSASVTGIAITSGTSGNTYTISGNTIGSTTVANSIVAATASSSTTAQVVHGINCSATGSGTGPLMVITNNTVANLYNNYRSAINSTTSGIRTNNTQTVTITGNTVHDLTTLAITANSSNTASCIGINAVASGSGNSSVSGNTIYNLANINGGSSTIYVMGIYLTLSGSGTNTVSGNLIHSLKTTNTSAGNCAGIVCRTGTVSLSNNMIRLGIDGSGSTINTGTYYGFYFTTAATTYNFYHNSVYIGGSSVTGSENSYCMYNTQISGTYNYEDNILVNARSNGSGTGKHYALQFGSSLPTSTMDYNLYYTPGTGGKQAIYNSTDYAALSDWQSISSKDANSLSSDPLYIDPTGGSSSVDLHLDAGSPAEAAGTSIGSVTTDYDGDTRSSFTPTDIGADAGDFGGITWSGATNTTWSTGTNWVGNAAPLSTENAIIPSGLSNYPDVSSGTVSCKALTVKSGGTLNVSGGTLQVAGALSNRGTFNATGGTVTLNGSSAQRVIAGTLTTTNLTLNNSAGATISSGTVNVLGTYTPTLGTLTAGGNLVLKSSASGTARIAAGSGSGGYISGNVVAERYIPGGRRAFRFLGHPFTSSLSMSSLTDDIDITGSGGSPFTTTNTNNPSAYYFDVTAGNNSTSGNNPGWTAYTASSSWAQYQVMRVLLRGAKGEGLTTAPYTPSAVTIDLTGVPNQGDITVPLTKGSSSDFVLVGNPFASQVNMDALTSSNVGSSFYIWDANQGTKGGYTSYSYGSSSFNLPVGGAFVTTLSASGSITFEEADKTSGTAGSPFKTTAQPNMVQLRLEDSTTFWDRLLLKFDDNAMAAVDYPDAVKLYNPEMTFYSISTDDSMLSIDARAYADSSVIPLGLYSTLKKNFKIAVTDFNMPLGTKLFLHDKFLSKTEEITGSGYEYWFTVTADSASWGNNRFELNTLGKPVNGIAEVNNSKLKAKLVPNPATDIVTVYTEGSNGKQVRVTVTGMTGIKVAELYTTGNAAISLSNMAAGIYIVNISCGAEIITQKLIKQ